MCDAAISITGAMALSGKGASRVFHSTRRPSPTVPRYVLLNSMRAKLVAHAPDWGWSHLHVPALIDSLHIPLSIEEPFSLGQPISQRDLAACAPA
jgi:hypothetical protein